MVFNFQMITCFHEAEMVLGPDEPGWLILRIICVHMSPEGEISPHSSGSPANWAGPVPM